MDQSIIDIIRSQTGCEDIESIQRTFAECGEDVVKTIMQLSSVTEAPPRNTPTPSEFDEIRRIVDEKENIYFERNKGI
jgi:hypothetical protein